MEVALVDVDGKIPNIALMKISAWHKAQGDSVNFHRPLIDHPEICYASKIFDFTPDYGYFPDCEIIRGGTGYDLNAKLPDEIERMFPDYSLYNCDYALGRFTRGCPNRCPWCVVPKMDGNEVVQVASLHDFWNGQKFVRLLDDNIMANEGVFISACKELSQAGVKVTFDALDIRLVNERTAKALASVKHKGTLHFSWDGHSQDEAVPRGLKLLENAGIKPYRCMFYILIGYNTTREYDAFRCDTLRELGTYPFVMPFDKSDRYQKDMARWANNKAVWRKCRTFTDYDCPTNREVTA